MIVPRQWVATAVAAVAISFAAPAGAAVVYSITDLGTLGGTLSESYGINASGQVTGTAALAGDATAHAFVYTAGVMTDLGTLGGAFSYGFGINASGQVTGYSLRAGNNPNAAHAFLYTDGVMTDLNNLIDPNSGWTLSSGRGINDAGQITANGINASGHMHALLLTPLAGNVGGVPEPASWALMLSGFGLAGAALRHRRTATRSDGSRWVSGPSASVI